jgi:tetratricopeptide (TPR) repeat protein
LSNPLWLGCHFEERIKIGLCVENAANRIAHYKALTRAIIKDVGWTSVELQKSDAKNIIEEGMRIATERNDCYMLATGYRYLFSFYLRQNKLQEAEPYLNNYLTETNKLNDSPHKTELMAEYHFAKASLENKKGNYTEALSEIRLAETEYERLPDKEWKIKIKAREGDILLEKGDINKAIGIFDEGLKDSKRYQYKRQEVKNLTGFGACYIKNGRLDDAKTNLNKAETLAKQLNLKYELDIIEKHKVDLKRKQSK